MATSHNRTTPKQVDSCPAAAGYGPPSSGSSSTLKRSAKLSSVHARQIFGPSPPAAFVGASKQGGNIDMLDSPPRATWASIQAQQLLMEDEAAANSLRSPAKIGSSPIQGRSIFPDSPAGLRAKMNLNKQAEDLVASSSSSTSSLPPKKRFDLSDWQFDLAAIADQQGGGQKGQRAAGASTPTNSGSYFPISSTPKGISLEVGLAPQPLTSSRTVLRPRKSGNLLSTSMAGYVPMSAPQPTRSRQFAQSTGGTSTTAAPSRLPVPKASANNHTAQTVVMSTSPFPSTSTPFPSSSTSNNPPASSGRKSLRPLAIRTTTPAYSGCPTANSSISSRLQLSESKSLLGHRRLVRGKENDSGFSSSTIFGAGSSSSNGREGSSSGSLGDEHLLASVSKEVGQEGDGLGQMASSFDACASALRHRHRTLSISESEGGHSESENGEEGLPDSPDLLSAEREQYVEDAQTQNLQDEMDVEMDLPTSTSSRRQSLLPLPQPSRHDSNESSASDELSPFLDTPGRKRGASLPFHELSNSSSSRYILGASLPPHPNQPGGTLKSSRVSYPPKMLNFNPETIRAKEGLYASVPASGSNTPSASRPVDQLFLASILNGSISASTGLSPSTSYRSSNSSNNSNNLKDMVEESPRRRSLPNNVSFSSTTKGLQPLSPNILHVVGRKRNANGAMIPSAANPLNNNNNQQIATKRKSSGRLISHQRSKSQCTEGSNGADSRRPSVDITDDEYMDGATTISAPSLPTLTDSSSATSSLASSHRSASNIRFGKNSNGDMEMHDGEESFSMEDVSFLSAVGGADSSFASSTSNDSSADIGVIGHVRRTSSSNAKLSEKGNHILHGTPSSSNPGQAKKASPHFKNVRPLAAAFVNSGLMSKKAYARSRIDRDSGIGLGMTPPAPAWKRLVGGGVAGSEAGTPGRVMPGSARSFVSSNAGNNVSFGSPGNLSFASSSFGSPVPTLEIAQANQSINSHVEPAPMPDTPCKRTLFSNNLRIATTAGNAALHPLAQSSRPVQDRSPSSCSSTSDSSSVVNSIPGSVVKSRPAVSPSPHQRQQYIHSPSGPACGSPSSSGSPCGSVSAGTNNLTVDTAAAGLPGAGKQRPAPLRRIGPALFRRRSSGQLSSGPDGGLLTIERSGGSSRSGIQDWEPMTPTRTVSGMQWTNIPQLAVSPQPSPGLLDTRTEDLAMHALVSPTSPLCAVPPYLSSTFRAADRALPASLPRPPLPHITGLKRPAFRTRHSSSFVQTARHTELLSPDRFATLFSINRTLGQGEFSEAYEVAERQTGQIFAVKKTKVPFGGPKDRLRRLEEVDILRLLSNATPTSPHVIKLFDAWEQSGNLYIQTEVCSHGNLATFLQEYGQLYEILDEARVWKIMSEIASGLAHIHSQGVLHLDLKPANIFITSQGGLKIGDFGLATRWPRASAVTILQGAAVDTPGWDNAVAAGIWPADRMRAKSSGAIPAVTDIEREGDREYIAPEILDGQYGKEADMFSLGLIVLEAAVNVVLPDMGKPWHKLRTGDFSDVELGHLSDELEHVIRQLLSSKPATRPRVEDLLSHPVMAKVQSLRAQGIRVEEANDSLKDIDDNLPKARGAVIAEEAGFLQKIFAEVRHAWHSPRRGKPTLVPDTQMMDVDDA